MKLISKKCEKLVFLILTMTLICCSPYETELRLASLFSNNMVLQQNSKVPIWGWAEPGSKIVVKTSWGESVSVTTASDGKWMLKVKTLAADNRVQTISVSAGKTNISIDNVLFGEVWLASGQSNMEMPMRGWLPKDPILNSEQEIQNADYPSIRMFTVERNKSFIPLEECQGLWKVCNPDNAPGFSATAYFYARELHKQLNVPIGIIHSSWSGSPAESWVDADFISQIEGYEDIKENLVKASDQTSPYSQWLNSMKSLPQSDFINNENFKLSDNRFKDIMKVAYEDSHWDTVSTSSMDKVFQSDDFNGLAWFRQEFTFEGDINSDEYDIFLGKIEDLNAVFINGILVGRTEHWGDNNEDQQYQIPSKLLRKEKNLLAVRVIDVWERGGLMDRPAIVKRNGEIVQTLSDSWRYLRTGILLNEDFYVLKNGFEDKMEPEPGLLPLSSQTPTVLYNAMIAPLVPYSIKGAIWYQGESNIGKSKQYHTLFPAVFQSWRSHWHIGDFPFYYVQLAPFDYGSDMVADLREAQLFTMKESNVGMAVTMDIGSTKTIHPPNKQEVGKRLALWALAKDYGKSGIVYSGPLYKSVVFKDDSAIVSFDHIGSGLYAPDQELSFFEVAGEDLIFYPAKAVIQENKVVVRSYKVPNPKIVRFAWQDTAMPNLFNKEGLPASPFRTRQ